MPDTKLPLVALDDDPTGAQLVNRARICVDLAAAAVRRAAADGVASVHLLTNARALTPTAAYAKVLAAAGAARAALPSAPLVIRGDSTLRGHLLEEYSAVRDACFGGRPVPLLLAPALPSAGRVTVAGTHLLERDGARVPLSETDYARDPDLGYTTSRLLDWAEQRSQGFFAAGEGREIGLDALRGGSGEEAIVAAARELVAGGRPGVIVPDAIEFADLERIGRAVLACHSRGIDLAVRCSPALVPAIADNLAPGPPQLDPVEDGVLVVCGSFVELTGRQLAALERAWPDRAVTVDPAALASAEGEVWEGESQRLLTAARRLLAAGGLAILTTPRRRDRSLDGPARARLAERLAEVCGRIEAGAVVAKGGITSALTFSHGLGATLADVLGPLRPGVSVWRPLDGPRAGSTYVVVPGNVGDDRLLVDVVGAFINDRKENLDA